MDRVTMSPSNRTVENIFCKSLKGRSAIHGNSYHLRLTIMILLRAYRMHQLNNEFSFTVAVEVAASGKFDDILYHYTSPRLATGLLFIQAKHRLNTDGRDGNVSKKKHPSVESDQYVGSMLTEKALLTAWNSKSAYSIPMYFMSFLEVDQHLPNEARYVLCTNASLDKNIECYFTIINPQKDNALLFCEDIGATCYQFSRDKPLPLLIDTLRDSCLAKLGKIFTGTIVAGKVVTLNDTLVNTFYGLINACLEPLKQKTSDSSVSTFKFKKGVFNAHEFTPTGKFLKVISKEYETLLKKRKQKYVSRSLHELVIKIDKRSLTSFRNKRPSNLFAAFDQKVHEFCAKFLLVCNSFNEETLREKALSQLTRWCDSDSGIVFDKLQGIVLEALKSDKLVPLNLKIVQQCFVNIELKQHISSLRNFSEEYLRSLHRKHSQIEVDPKYFKRTSVHAFLQNKFSYGVYQFNSLLDLTISSYILVQMLSHSNYETLFLNSAQYQNAQDMKLILEDLLSYLKAVNHSTILTILGKHDRISIKEIKELSKKYCQRIIVVDKTSRTPQKVGPLEWFFGNNLKHKAWSNLFKENDQLMFGTVSSLDRMVDATDDLSFLLAILEFCKQSNKLKCNSLQHDYDRIKKYYIHRYVVPYQENGEENHSRFYQYAMRSKDIVRSNVKNPLDSQDKEPDPPGVEEGCKEKVHIFLNDAGHGKTCYFTWLAWRLSTYDRSLYVIKFIAKEYSTDFQLFSECDIQNLNDTEIVRLLYKCINLAIFVPNVNRRATKETELDRGAADGCAKLLTVLNGQIVLNKAMEKELSTKELILLRLFREKFNQQKLVLILDGFDEIVPCYKDVVLACFARFARLDGVRSLYLSSRPYGFDADLKKTFVRCRLYQLELFSWEDILFSWHKFHQSNLPGAYVMLQSKLHDLITVPLFLYMVQTVILSHIKKYGNLNSNTISSFTVDNRRINAFNLVEGIIDKMIAMFPENKTRSTYSSLQTNENNERRERNINRHMYLAMYVIFAKKDREKLLSEVEKKVAEKLLEDLIQGKGKTAFVLGVVNGEPIFVHFIFAEFFAAYWLYKNRHRFRRESIFQSQAFWSSALDRIRYFFSSLLLKESDGCELHWTILNSWWDRVRGIVFGNRFAVAVKDKAGRLPIHLTPAIEEPFEVSIVFYYYGHTYMISWKDDLFGWSALDYAFVQNAFWLVDQLLSEGISANVDTLFQQLCSNDTEIALQQGIEYVSCLEKYPNQTATANELCERVARYIINEKKADIYAPREQLFTLSMLEYCVKNSNALMFRHLMICDESNNSSLSLTKLVRAAYGWIRPSQTNINGFIDRIFELSIREEAYAITNYLVEHRPFIQNKLKDMSTVALVSCAKDALERNNVTSFRAIFHHLCIKLQIPHVEEKHIFDERNIKSDETYMLDVNMPLIHECCLWNGTYYVEFQQYAEGNKFYIEGFLAHALNLGSVPMVSYILQKTKTNVTNALIILLMQLLKPFAIGNNNHLNSRDAFKYLLNKTLDLHIIDQNKRNLLQTIVQDGCLYMVPFLIRKGFDPKQIDRYHLQKLFETSSNERITGLFTYFQRNMHVDCFTPCLVGGHYVIDIAISFGNNNFVKKLFEEKYFDYSEIEKENALIEILERMLVKYGAKKSLCQFNEWKSDRFTDDIMFNYMAWDSVYSSIRKKIPIV